MNSGSHFNMHIVVFQVRKTKKMVHLYEKSENIYITLTLEFFITDEIINGVPRFRGRSVRVCTMRRNNLP